MPAWSRASGRQSMSERDGSADDHGSLTIPDSPSRDRRNNMRKIPFLAAALTLAALPAFAQNVKITPVGSHPGELCANDRAMILEDPTGVRLFYDPAHNITGGDDPRLGTIHAVVLNLIHVHPVRIL